MSYSTALYAVNLDRLKSAIGSGDQRLMESIRSLETPPPNEMHRRRRHWVAILEDGSVLLDGKQSSAAAVSAAYRLLDKHDEVHFLSRDAETTKGVFASLSDITIEFQGNAAKIQFHPSTMELSDFHAYDESASNDEAGQANLLENVCNLISGKTSINAASNILGYSLLKLCQVMGRQLDDGDALGEIAGLQLESKLSTHRDLPGFATNGDFPIVSHLTPKEVVKELSRFEKAGVDYPDDPDVEAGRKAFVKCLREAADAGLAIVSFYY